MENMTDKFYEYNSALQRKKARVRKAIAEMGTLKREGKNTFDNYTYFSEMQYKLLFNPIFAREGLELKVSEKDHELYDGPGKQPEGRVVTLQIDLIDVDTGYFESSIISGDGIDKGDKGIYKAMTGAIKYYLSTTFLVPTGDDAEKPSKNETVSEVKEEPKVSEDPIDHIKKERRRRKRSESADSEERKLIEELPFD